MPQKTPETDAVGTVNEEVYTEAMETFTKEWATKLHELYRKLFPDDEGYDSNKMLAVCADAMVVFLATFGEAVVSCNPEAEDIENFDPFAGFVQELFPLLAARGAGFMLSEEDSEAVSKIMGESMKPPDGKVH